LRLIELLLLKYSCWYWSWLLRFSRTCPCSLYTLFW